MMNKMMQKTMPKKYVNLLSDSGFKAVFADERNKDVVIDFLNVVFDGERIIKDLTFVQGELSGRTITSKGVRFDLICREEDGTTFVVEMQRVKNSEDFYQRTVYYGSVAYTNQLNAGDMRYNLSPVYVIGIMEGQLAHKKQSNDCHIISRFEMREDVAEPNQPKTISCIFVQLGNFKLTDIECKTGFDMWCYTLKTSSQLIEKPSNFDRPGFDRLYDACEIARFDKDKRIIFEREFMTEFDYQHDLYYSKEEGRKEGREEGKLEATQVVAKNMKSLGFDTKAICKCTSLTEDQVKAL